MTPNTTQSISSPEIYYLPPTKYVPNSPLPLLVYRDVLPQPITEESCQEFAEAHGWTRKGPIWGAVYRRHFHPNTHECYGELLFMSNGFLATDPHTLSELHTKHFAKGILKGSSVVLMGVGTSDQTEGRDHDDFDSAALGLRLTLNAGDMVVHPAGMSHSNFSAEDDYAYLSFFPNGGPQWKSENGSTPLDLEAMYRQIMSVPIPEDPAVGGDGHLGRLWREAAARFKSEQKV